MAGKPLSQAGPDFAKRLKKMSTAIEDGRRDTLKQAGMVAKREHGAVIESHSGGDSRLSGVGKKGATVGVRFDISGDRVEIKATGPLHFLANPMSPHRIPKQRKRGGRRVVVIPGVGVRAHANHPGTPGKDTWRVGARRAQPKVAKVIESEVSNIVKRGFG